MNHLKPLFIRSKVKDTAANKILIDGEATVNLMPYFLLKKNGKYDTFLRPYNMVLSKYEGKNWHTLGVIQVKVTIGLITRPTVFIVITSRASYNLLLSNE